MSFGVTVNGKNVKSKAALKKAMAEDPDSVRFFDTSMFNNKGSNLRPNDLKPGLDVIVGPDVFNDRRWFANVKQKRDGSWTVV